MPRQKKDVPSDAAHARLVTALVATELGTPSLNLDDPSERDPQCDFARQIAIYLYANLFGHNLSRIGRQFGRHRSTVAHSLRVVEDSRTDPALDDALDRMERWLEDVVPA
jgi:chromosomal replication initiation ATPase DnaA